LTTAESETVPPRATVVALSVKVIETFEGIIVAVVVAEMVPLEVVSVATIGMELGVGAVAGE
jgi:hypothetical protein